jgi:hypothetical protein
MRPRRIGLSRADAVVRSAIDLNRQSGRRTVEVENINPSRMLSPEFQTSGPRPQNTPQHTLG